MSSLKIRPGASDAKGRAIHVTPAKAGWTYVGFDLCRLKPGESARGHTRDREVCLVLVSGKAAIGAEGVRVLEKGLDPDLILTELMMPVMSGWDLCETLKRSEVGSRFKLNSVMSRCARSRISSIISRRWRLFR